MINPIISNRLRGSLGELYYKEYCDQRGWAYTSLESIYSTLNSKQKWDFTFKKGFNRIQIDVPKEIQSEINMLVRPTNNSLNSPSFVFDFLACKVKNTKKHKETKSSDSFTWVEIKTGKGIFSATQLNAMSKIKLPLAIFHIDDILKAPEEIQMNWDIKEGKEWLDEIVPIDNEIYEFAKHTKLTKKI